MIPKIIHYCWFGGNPLPPLALECIASWRKYLPEYEIWQWSEDPSQPSLKGQEFTADKVMTFDVHSIPYTAEAYRQKKFAFVSDYCRFVAMYEYGGIYFDTDVEVIRPMDEIIAKGNFMGFEVDPDGENTPGKYAPRYCFGVNVGLGFGFEKEHSFINNILQVYSTILFDNNTNDPEYKTVVEHVTETLIEMGLRNVKGVQHVGDITIYPHEYFAPINVISGKLKITENTVSIHRYMGSWTKGHLTPINLIKQCLRQIMPEFIVIAINKYKRNKTRKG